MSAARFELTNTDNYPRRHALEQGSTFDWLSVVIEGDFSSWTPRGQVRTKYAELGGILKASFAFDPLTFREVTLANGKKILGTVIHPILSSEDTFKLDWATSKMVTRRDFSDPPIPGKNVWVYDVEIVSPKNEVRRVLEGFVEVSLEATR